MCKSIVVVAIALWLQVAWVPESFAAASAESKGDVVEKPVTADTPEKFAQVAVQIREQMQANGRYEFIHPGDKVKANVDLDTIASILQKSGSVGALSESEKVRLFNTQEHLNGILVHNDGNRLVCERHAPVGTNIPVNTCKTFAELEKERRDGQKYMQDSDRRGWTCTGPKNPSCPNGYSPHSGH
jgi:hypothetical protein